MAAPDTLRYAKIPLTNGSGAIPALGFGTLIPDPLATNHATKTALAPRRSEWNWLPVEGGCVALHAEESAAWRASGWIRRTCSRSVLD